MTQQLTQLIQERPPSIRNAFTGIIITISFVFIHLLSGCASTSETKEQLTSSSGSIVFGYLEMDAESTNIDVININNSSLHKDGKKPLALPSVKVVDSLFFVDTIELGDYFVSGFKSGDTSVTFKKEHLKFSVSKPGVYFLGSYRYKTLPSGRYTLVPSLYPTKRDLLNRLLIFYNDTPWYEKIKAELHVH